VRLGRRFARGPQPIARLVQCLFRELLGRLRHRSLALHLVIATLPKVEHRLRAKRESSPGHETSRPYPVKQYHSTGNRTAILLARQRSDR
jgi:hypothetical protein